MSYKINLRPRKAVKPTIFRSEFAVARALGFGAGGLVRDAGRVDAPAAVACRRGARVGAPGAGQAAAVSRDQHGQPERVVVDQSDGAFSHCGARRIEQRHLDEPRVAL